MAFLDEIGKTLTDMGKDAAQRAKEVAEVLQLKTQINSEKARIRELYIAIGKIYFEQHQGEPEEQFMDTFTEIQNALGNISELEARISKIDGSKVCTSCGAVIDQDAAFCSKCGASAVVTNQELMVVEDDAFDVEDTFTEE